MYPFRKRVPLTTFEGILLIACTHTFKALSVGKVGMWWLVYSQNPNS